MWEINLEGNAIASTYSILSGHTASKDYPYIVMAAAGVEARLAEGVNPADQRLTFLTATLANLYSIQAEMSREPESNSLLGVSAETSAATGYKERLEAAQSMVNAFTAACAPLLKDTSFFFERTDII